MVDLSVEIAGVRFPNPVLVGSCSLTSNLRGVRALAQAGAGGIITKTISPDPMPGPPRGFRIARSCASLAVSADPRLTVDEGSRLISEARDAVEVPIVGNVIGRSDDAEVWAETCQELERAGAHMIELDLNCHPDERLELGISRTQSLFDTTSIGQDPAATARVVEGVCGAVDIPVISKMTLRAPDLAAVAEASIAAGADAISGVNALHGIPGIEVGNGGAPHLPGFDDFTLVPICGPDLAQQGRKWTALLTRSIDAPYISGSGITTPDDAAERLLLGAYAVAVCSAVYLHGPAVVSELVEGLARVADHYGVTSVAELRGVASSRLLQRGKATSRPVVARVVDATLWAAAADRVFELSNLGCSCITRTDGEVGFAEERCTGCALPLVHSPEGALEMVPV
jgi:dihydroorotate dehydrogenase